MADSMMIDSCDDGPVSNFAVSAVPDRKQDLVTGHYDLPAPKGKAMVAVKIVDMLCEDVLSTAEC